MLNEKRIIEAEKNMKKYLDEEMIRKQGFSKLIFDTYMRNYKESLSLLSHIHENNLSKLWTIVIAYYSMFYITNAVLLKIGYKVGSKLSHKVAADALIKLGRHKLRESLLEDYEEAKEEALEIASAKADSLVESFDNERRKRSVFQYETTDEIKSTKAETSFKRAKEFGSEMEKMIDSMSNKRSNTQNI